MPEGSFAFINDVDRPMVNIATLIKLLNRKFHSGYLVPEFDRKNGHPLLLGKKVIRSILKRKPEKTKMNEFLRRFERRSVKVNDKGVLININTPEDYKKWAGV